MKKLLFALLIPVIFACSDDPEPATVELPEPTNIDKMVGNYTYTAVATSLADANITVDFEGDLAITNDSPFLYKLELDDDGGTYNLSDMAEATDAAVFNVSDLTLTDSDGDAFIVSGIEQFTVAGKSYHGKYDTNSQQLTLTLVTDYVNNDYDILNTKLEILATKK